jgi:hypothetical protein
MTSARPGNNGLRPSEMFLQTFNRNMAGIEGKKKGWIEGYEPDPETKSVTIFLT